jgi:hypothetical protein
MLQRTQGARTSFLALGDFPNGALLAFRQGAPDSLSIIPIETKLIQLIKVLWEDWELFGLNQFHASFRPG